MLQGILCKYDFKHKLMFSNSFTRICGLNGSLSLPILLISSTARLSLLIICETIVEHISEGFRHLHGAGSGHAGHGTGSSNDLSREVAMEVIRERTSSSVDSGRLSEAPIF
jgi:hypothetical protein